MLEYFWSGVNFIISAIIMLGALGGLGVFCLLALPEEELGRMAGKAWAKAELHFWNTYNKERDID